MKSYLFILFIASSFIACINGTASEDISKTDTITLPGVPLSLPNITVDTIEPIDIHDQLSSIQKYGNVNISVLKNSVAATTGDLSFISHIKITIALDASNNNSNLPETPFVDVDIKPTNEADLPILMNTDQVMNYLNSGKVNLHFYLTGTIPQSPTNLTHTLSLHIDGNVDKSISDLGSVSK